MKLLSLWHFQPSAINPLRIINANSQATYSPATSPSTILNVIMLKMMKVLLLPGGAFHKERIIPVRPEACGPLVIARSLPVIVELARANKGQGPGIKGTRSRAPVSAPLARAID